MKKFLAFVIIVISIVTLTAFAEEPEIAIMRPIGEPSESGYQAYGLFDAEGNQIIPVERTPGISLFSTLPESYDSRDFGYISPVRNQGAFGTCWAHAFVACAEANMIKKGYEANFNNYSELHLAYFYHKRNEVQGDGVDNFDSKNGYGYFGGGNGYYAAQFAENFQDLAVESDFPYSLASNSADFSIDEAYRNHSDVHMVDFGKLNSIEDAKRAIMEYGAVSLGYASVEDEFPLSEDFGYYQNKYTGTNHEVTVVGWDDNFPVESFNEGCRPSNPGAWLIKNSWGKTFGDFGYFWLSYEDPSIALGNYYEFEPIGDENIVHTHNGGTSNIVWEVMAANVFPIEEDQTLTSIGFEAETHNVVPEKYEIMIYVSNSKPSNPMSGSAKQTLKGDVPCDGFHKVTLDKPISLKEGQYLSIICILSDSNKNVAASKFESGDNYTSEPGESYYGWNGIWYDTHNLDVGGGTVLKNATIKAYCKSDTATVYFNTREAEHFATQTVNIGECVEKPEDPIMEGYDFLGWYTNNTVTEEWDFSTPVTHDMRLFAKWSEPENVNLRVASEYFSTSFNPGVGLAADNIKDFTLYFAKDNKFFTFSSTFGPDKLNTYINYAFPIGEYKVFADVKGVNGEEFSSDIEHFTVTDQPALSVHEGHINIVNIPPYGADLYVAQYDSEGRFVGVEKTSHYRRYASNGTDIISHKRIEIDENLKNPKYFLWNTGTTVPLCEEN